MIESIPLSKLEPPYSSTTINLIPQWPQRGTATKPSETGRNGCQEGRFFRSRPVTWCILVIRSLIAFINPHIFESTSPKIDESRLNITPHSVPDLMFNFCRILLDNFNQSGYFSPVKHEVRRLRIRNESCQGIRPCVRFPLICPKQSWFIIVQPWSIGIAYPERRDAVCNSISNSTSSDRHRCRFDGGFLLSVCHRD